MKLKTLTFQGPFTQADLVNISDAFEPGIYIWGFMSDQALKPYDKFIPYYVGKSESSVVGRFIQHKKDILKVDSTYMRFTVAYMKRYFNDIKFPINLPNSKAKFPSWLNNNKSYFIPDNIAYINNKDFNNQFKIRGKGPDYPISLMSNCPDYLGNHVNDIQICFAKYQGDISNKQTMRKDLEALESVTKCSLLGKTVGHAKPFNFALNNQSFYQINSKINGPTIFKKVNGKVVVNCNLHP